MRKCSLILFLCILFVNLSAQKGYEGIFLFEEFMPGRVIYKQGAEITTLLNYNKVDEKMYFILQNPDSTMLELTMTSLISDVIVGERAFEHIKDGQFYERVELADDFLYIRWRSTLVSEGSDIGYGRKSTTGAVDNATQAFGHSTNRRLASSESFKTNDHNTYFFKKNGKFNRFNSFNALAKQFKKQEKIIKEYIKADKLNFNNVDDVKKAVLYCFQITK